VTDRASATDPEPVPAVRVVGVTRDFDIERGAGGTIKHTVLGRARGRREHFRALDEVTLDIPKGALFALVGHNGSGKSTMLKLIAGIFPPTAGTVDVNGRVTALLELGAGFHPELTGRENAYLAGAIAGLTRAQVAADIESVKQFTGLDEFFEAPVKTYSSGMFVRLGFAVAVHLDPEILIVDEVVAVGDESFQRQCFDHLRKLRRRGVTIIFVSHSLGLVEQLADRAAWLDHGRLRVVGTAREVVDAYLTEVNAKERAERAATVVAETEARENSDHGDHADGDDADGSAAPSAPDAIPGTPERALYRNGNGLARITDVQFLGSDRAPTEIVQYGEPMTIRIHYRCTEPLAEPNFGLAVWSEQGWPICAPNTRLHDHPTGHVTGSGSIDFEVLSCPFVPGRLTITAAITDHSTTEVYDWVERGWELTVLPGHGFGPTGVVAVDGTWTGPGIDA